MARSRKAFHFDLDDIALKEHYDAKKGGENAWKSAWSDIKSFMESHGFKHSQYSGYESVEPMTYDKAYEIVESLNETYPWFRICAQAATLTEVGRRHDVLEYLDRVEEPTEEPAIQELDSPLSSEHSARTSLKDEALSMREASKALREDGGYEPPHKENPQR